MTFTETRHRNKQIEMIVRATFLATKSRSWLINRLAESNEIACKGMYAGISKTELIVLIMDQDGYITAGE